MVCSDLVLEVVCDIPAGTTVVLVNFWRNDGGGGETDAMVLLREMKGTNWCWPF